MQIADLDLDAPAPSRINLRDYQLRAMEAVAQGWEEGFSRQLLDAATGTGKSTIFAAIAAANAAAGIKTLILENRDALVRQTVSRIEKETGLEVDIEMASEVASPFVPVVVASVPTLCRTNRLTGFAPDHFGMVVCDECHHSLAASFLKVCNYFHYGAASLEENWQKPPDGTYQVLAKILGVTATPDIGDRRSLAELYQRVAFQYQLIQAVADGWLVGPIAKNIPLKVDLRGLKTGRTPQGSDFKIEDLTERLVPVLESLADQIVELAHDRKTIAFVPSVECARILADAITRKGLNGIFVSGACLDVDEKTDAYRNAGPGTVLCNCALYVEGADFPDTDCVVIARATKSSAFYRQMVGRATRVLPGTVDGLETAAERRAAIAASRKPNFLLLDPLWVSDRIDLCDAYDLFTDKPEVKERMKSSGAGPNEEAAREAERDFIKALEKEAKKHARKQARTINPLAIAVCLGDDTIRNYVPEPGWGSAPPTPGQIGFLKAQGVATDQIKYKGLAQKLIGRIMTRLNLKLATVGQLNFMLQLGMDEQSVGTLTQAEATALIDSTLAAKKAARS